MIFMCLILMFLIYVSLSGCLETFQLGKLYKDNIFYFMSFCLFVAAFISLSLLVKIVLFLTKTI